MFNKSRMTALIALTLLANPSHAGWLKGRNAAPEQTAVAQRPAVAVPQAEGDQLYLQQTDALVQARLDESIEAKQDPLMANFEGTPAEAAAKFKALLDKAEQGDLAAQVLVGWAYQHGKGVAQSYKAAAFWYTQASNKGSVDGSLRMGHLHADGRMFSAQHGGVGDTPAERAQELAKTQAAHNKELADLEALHLQGLVPLDTIRQLRAKYNTRNIPELNQARAVFWFLRAADAGNVEAQVWCGWYFAGDLLPGAGYSASNVYQTGLINFNALHANRRREILGIAVGPTEPERAALAIRYYTLAKAQGSTVAAQWVKAHPLMWFSTPRDRGRDAWIDKGTEIGNKVLDVPDVSAAVALAIAQNYAGDLTPKEPEKIEPQGAR